MIFLLYTGTSALIIYISNIQGTKKYSAVMYYPSGHIQSETFSTPDKTRKDELMLKPVFCIVDPLFLQCPEGHLVCDDCNAKMVECPQVVYLANLTKSPQPHGHPNVLHPVWSQPDERPQPNSRGSCSEAQPAPRRSVDFSVCCHQVAIIPGIIPC